MKKRALAIVLSLAMAVSLLPMGAMAASVERVDRVNGRNDGTWLFPAPSKYYNSFTDWAGCPGRAECKLCGQSHKNDGWGDSYHDNVKNGTFVAQSNGNGHNGFDLGTPNNTEVYASAAGTVRFAAQPSGGYAARGITVVIEHPTKDGYSYYSYYQHLSSTNVKVGAKVKAGDVIAKSGNTGTGSGSHLHFGMVMGKSNKFSMDYLYQLECKGFLRDNKLGEGSILVNPSVSSPSFPTGSRTTIAPLANHSGSISYTFDKNKVSIGLQKVELPSSELTINLTSTPKTINQGSIFNLKGKITSNYMITELKATVINKSNKKEALPTIKYDPQSMSVDIYKSRINTDLAFNKLGAGTYILTITAKDASGEKGREVTQDFTVKEVPSTLKINLTSWPTILNKGKDYNLKGTVKSNYKITQLTITVTDEKGKTVLDPVDYNPKKTSVDLASCNSALAFNKLDAGTYTLTIIAGDASGICVAPVKKTFTVKNVTDTTPAPKINLTKYPTTINKGSSFGLYGTVTSGSAISSVHGYVINKATNETVLTSVDKPTSAKTSMDINKSNLNNKLTFNKLVAGTYTLKVVAKDADGKSATWSKDFTVKEVPSTLKINLTSYPKSIKKYSSFGLYGSITSNYKITEVRGYVIDVKDNYVELSSLDKPNKTSMDINKANLNKDLTFNTLYRDTYTLKIVAKDASGKTVTWSKTFKVT